MILCATASLLVALLLVASCEASESPPGKVDDVLQSRHVPTGGEASESPPGKVDDVLQSRQAPTGGEASESPPGKVDALEAQQVPTGGETAKSSEEEVYRPEDFWVVPEGLTAKNLEEYAEKVEKRKILIHYAVVKRNGKKHVLLSYYDFFEQNCIDIWLLADLFPLDISAFIERGLAKEDDELDVEFRDQEVIARIRQDPSSLDAGGDKEPVYTLPIHRAGAIGYVRLSEIEHEMALTGVDANGQGKVGSEDKEKLYYVRLPLNLFTKLDDEGLRLLSYRKNTCKASSTSPAASASSIFDCLVVTFGRRNEQSGPKDPKTIELVTPLYLSEIPHFYFITSKKVGNIAPNSRTTRTFATDPSASVQYVVLAGLTEFNRMEPKFVEKHGRLVKQKPKIRKGKLELKFEKDRKTTIIPFRVESCPRWATHCLRTDMIEDELKDDEPAEMGVTYSFNGKWGMT